MPSVIPGYEYDIFISYRQKDNRGDHWVTEFVKALRSELDATFKEDISIYFDENPNDGLLETHNVDKSLQGKLKCLIFIPIISHTYCDPKSFAWQHEFCAFNKQVRQDQFGSDIKLSNGNVASRILPIKIHDLDEEDEVTIENEIEGAIRAIDFIYKTPGVNRPLRSNDDETKEITHAVFYRDQINKVANAVKEITTSLKLQTSKGTAAVRSGKPHEQIPIKIRRRFRRWIVPAAIIMLTAGSYFVLFRKDFFNGDASRNADKSVAVLAFEDMSPTHDQEYWGDGISEEIINVLAQTKGLKVIARSSSFQFKGKNEDLRTIGKMLGVATVLEGSVTRVKDQIKVTVQLIRTSDGSHIWSKRFDQSTANIFVVQDEIARGVAEAFNATVEKNITSERKQEWNEKAYKLYQLGRFFYDRGGDGDVVTANDYFTKSSIIDSSQAIVWTYLAVCEQNSSNNIPLIDSLIEKALALDSNLGDAAVFKAENYFIDHKFNRAEAELARALRVGIPDSYLYRNAAGLSIALGRPTQGVAFGRKAVDLDPLQPHAFSRLAYCYFFNKQYDSCITTFRQLFSLSKNYSFPHLNLYYSLLSLGKNAEARKEAMMETDKVDVAFINLFTEFAVGRRRQADSLLVLFKKSKESDEWNYHLSLLHIFRGEQEEAIKSLYLAYKLNDPALYKRVLAEPWLDPIRGDFRFIALMKKMGLKG